MGKTGFMILTILIFLPLGAILEGVPAVVLLTPILLPLATQLGIDPVHYGAVIVATQGISVFLPPVGGQPAGGVLRRRSRAGRGRAAPVALPGADAGADGGDCARARSGAVAAGGTGVLRRGRPPVCGSHARYI